MAPHELVSGLRDEVGEDLRAVATYDREAYDLHYVRDDVRERYTAEEIEEIFEDLVLQGLGTGYLERLFHAGELECSVYGFEEAAMFHFAATDDRGLFVTFGRDTEVNLDSVIATCKGALER